MKTENIKNKSNIIFILCLLVGIVATVISVMFSKKVDYDIQKFGVVQDGTLYIDNDTEYKVRFKLQENNFDGIQLYLDFVNEEFKDSYINFALYDAKTNEFIDAYKMDLEYEYSKKFAYIPFHIADSEGKSVYLTIKGENIPEYVRAKYSETSAYKQTVYKNNKKTNKYFVMSGVYKKTGNAGINAVINFCVFLLFLLLLKFGKWSFGEQDVNSIQSVKSHSFRNFLVKHKKEVVFFFVVAFVSIVLFFYYNLKIDNLVGDKKKVDEIIVTKQHEIVLGDDSEELTQVFTASEQDLSAFCLSLYATEISQSSKVNVKLIRPASGVELFNETYYVSDIAKNKRKNVKFQLDENIKKSEDEDYLIVLTPLDFETTKLHIDCGEKDGEINHRLVVDGVEQANNIAVSVVYSDVSFIKTEYVIFSIFIILFVIIAYYFCFYKKVSVEVAFLLLGFFLGILYMFVVTPYGVPDEASHVDTAYRYSNRILGIPKSEKSDYDYKRFSDIDGLTDMESRTAVNIYAYQRMYSGFFEKVEQDNLTECYMRDNSMNGGIFYYFPGCIGVTIARLLHLGTMQILLLGRFCTLIAYLAIVFFAIRKIPNGKMTMLILALLPISLQQAASFSYDALINAYAMLYLANVLYLSDKNTRIQNVDVALVFVLGLLLIACKSGVYSPLCLLLLYVPIKRNELNRKTIITYGITFCLVVLFFAKSFLASILSRLGTKAGTISAGVSGNEGYTFGYFKSHPLRLISIMVNTVFERTEPYLKNILGGSMSWFTIEVGWLYGIVFLVLIIMSTGEIFEKIELKDRIIFGLISLASYFLINVSMLLTWTAKTYDFVVGAQGRYFIPFLYLFVAACAVQIRGNKNKMLLTLIVVHVLQLIRMVVVSI